ncbi:SIS domain-containing protein [Leeia sp. TBRC 13508]|uniref:SIS domain-containing protein n=1 Tax=Leeia speluncae TaxID=2884804 RepID=A0ABS8D392_9NEIS|nr:SIS domain-containing protein [Leeia speluncae]MCB6182622.1 SIS domain-containing protein [Leeia speluncae]
MDLTARIQLQCHESKEATDWLAEHLASPIAIAAELMVESLMQDGKVLTCGNGGSAALAQYTAALLLSRLENERPALSAIALGATPILITAIAADQGFQFGLTRQVEALAHPQDILLVFASHGSPENLQAAIQTAHDRGMRVIALTGREDADLAAQLTEDDLLLNIPLTGIARIQEMHMLAIHALCDAIDCLLLGVE